AARGSLDHFDSWGAIAGAMAPAGNFHVDYRVARQGDAWQVRQADLTLPGTPSRLALRGRVLLPATAANGAGNLDLDLQASWRDAAWPPRGKPSFASPRGEAHVVAHASGAGAPAGSLSSEGTVQAVVTSLGPVAASYRLTRQGGDWRLEKMEAAVPGTATHLAASGRLTQRGQGFDVDAAVNWR